MKNSHLFFYLLTGLVACSSCARVEQGTRIEEKSPQMDASREEAELCRRLTNILLAARVQIRDRAEHISVSIEGRDEPLIRVDESNGIKTPLDKRSYMLLGSTPGIVEMDCIRGRLSRITYEAGIPHMPLPWRCTIAELPE